MQTRAVENKANQILNNSCHAKKKSLCDFRKKVEDFSFIKNWRLKGDVTKHLKR